MFEKEAEEKGVEYANKQKKTTSIHEDTGYSWGQVEEGYENGFKDGAEFGYNKANEWYYVKDGIYPTHSNRVLVFTDEGVGFGLFGLDNKKWYTYDTGFEVIAWKEIVLPKEVK